MPGDWQSGEAHPSALLSATRAWSPPPPRAPSPAQIPPAAKRSARTPKAQHSHLTLATVVRAHGPPAARTPREAGRAARPGASQPCAHHTQSRAPGLAVSGGLDPPLARCRSAPTPEPRGWVCNASGAPTRPCTARVTPARLSRAAGPAAPAGLRGDSLPRSCWFMGVSGNGRLSRAAGDLEAGGAGCRAPAAPTLLAQAARESGSLCCAHPAWPADSSTLRLALQRCGQPRQPCIDAHGPPQRLACALTWPPPSFPTTLSSPQLLAWPVHATAASEKCCFLSSLRRLATAKRDI